MVRTWRGSDTTKWFYAKELANTSIYSDTTAILSNAILKKISKYETFSKGKQYNTLFFTGFLMTQFLIGKIWTDGVLFSGQHLLFNLFCPSKSDSGSLSYQYSSRPFKVGKRVKPKQSKTDAETRKTDRERGRWRRWRENNIWGYFNGNEPSHPLANMAQSVTWHLIKYIGISSLWEEQREGDNKKSEG